MTAFLPPSLLALFEPRPPLPYLPIPNLKTRPLPAYTGIGEYMANFTDPATEDITTLENTETPQQKKARVAAERELIHKKQLAEALKQWDPNEPSEQKTTDPYHTLFVSRLDYGTTEETLRKTFEYYGPIKKLRIVTDPATGASRGYAFIEFERERDMKNYFMFRMKW